MCTLCFARSTERGSTGSDCSSQRLLPSSEIEGAEISFIEPIRQSIAVTMTGSILPITGSCSVSGTMTSAITSRLISTKTAAASMNTSPRPQLSMYVGLDRKRENSLRQSAENAPVCFALPAL